MTQTEILEMLNRGRKVIESYILSTDSIEFAVPNVHYKFHKIRSFNRMFYYIEHFSNRSHFKGGWASDKYYGYWFMGDNINEVFQFFVKNGIKPKINTEVDKYFDLICELSQKVQIVIGTEITFSVHKNNSIVNELLNKYKIQPINEPQKKEIPQPTEQKMNKELQNLLECDKKRIGVAAYDKKRFTNPNQGHWDIQEKDGKKIGDEIFFPRNPKDDIKAGVVGIDFGTRSTVVCYQDENSVRVPMPIGDNGSREFDTKRYENPTIMCFSSLEKFMKAYNAVIGRPDTDWNDLNVSHLAKKNFKDAVGNDFIAYLDNIKSWALGRNRKIKIKPIQEDKVYDLKPFFEVGENDINPVEYYAYFIGSYINDMVKGVHLHYYLSFPATVEKNAREKIRKSFENGIKKSLPKQILEDEGIMKKFYVNGDCSEPLAYAACALQEYGFTFEDENEPDSINYAIFDFGGGTTDYNFGVWKASDNDNYDYEIESFGGNGLPTMGGENLLEDLAFDIFKANLKSLTNGKKESIQFSYSPNAQIFPDADRYISESVEAGKNMHVMMEKLRDYWENSAEKLDGEDDKEGKIEFNDLQFYRIGDGEMAEKFEITTTKKFIRDFFRDKIRNAIRNFFAALKKIQGFENQDIKIFLAGNSCKSPFVEEIFDEEKGNLEEEGFNFEIFPPLGTDKANEIIRNKSINHSNDEVRPTGKTGVAFGLIETQRGGRIKISRKQQEDSFAFYIGKVSKHKFRHFDGNGGEMSVEGKPNLNNWYDFRQVEEGDTMFKLYYTDLPECVDDQLPDTATKNVTCEFDEVNNEANVYIRAISSNQIEYIVTDEGIPADDDTKIKKCCKTITLN
jgi:hypothetical protein